MAQVANYYLRSGRTRWRSAPAPTEGDASAG
jgi:hypothetical protein